MSRIKQILCVSAALGAACFAVAAGSLSASATTKEDVIAAARAAGFPEVYVQAGINKLNEEEYTSEDYDSFIAALPMRMRSGKRSTSSLVLSPLPPKMEGLPPPSPPLLPHKPQNPAVPSPPQSKSPLSI